MHVNTMAFNQVNTVCFNKFKYVEAKPVLQYGCVTVVDRHILKLKTSLGTNDHTLVIYQHIEYNTVYQTKIQTEDCSLKYKPVIPQYTLSYHPCPQLCLRLR